MSNFSRLTAIARWLRAHPVVTLLGIAGTVFGVIKNAPPAWEAAMEISGRPRCLGYASVYRYSTGVFKKQDGTKWIEYGDAVFNFKETHRDKNYIILLNTTPRMGRQSPMILKVPVCGGTLQWSYQNPQQWTDLYEIWPEAS